MGVGAPSFGGAHLLLAVGAHRRQGVLASELSRAYILTRRNYGAKGVLRPPLAGLPFYKNSSAFSSRDNYLALLFPPPFTATFAAPGPVVGPFFRSRARHCSKGEISPLSSPL